MESELTVYDGFTGEDGVEDRDGTFFLNFNENRTYPKALKAMGLVFDAVSPILFIVCRSIGYNESNRKVQITIVLKNWPDT
jgi:hypothetical protein